MTIITDLLTLLWLILPLVLANMAPVLVRNIPLVKKYDYPLDFHKTFRGKRIFGSHKTIRGLLAGVLFGALTAGLQIIAFKNIPALHNHPFAIDYNSIFAIWFGACLGFGGLAGDAIKSFFKRQIDIPPGKSWVPFDQLDLVVGGGLMSLLFFRLPVHYYLLGIGCALLLHPLFNFISWLLKLQKNPY